MSARKLEILEQGLIAGALGYAVLAVYHAVLNIAADRPFFATAGRLGEALFNRGDGAAASVIAFNGLHLAVSIGLGVAAAALVFAVERRPRAWYAFFFAALTGAMVGTLLAGIASVELTGAVSWPAAVSGSLLATFAALGYLWIAHPALRTAAIEAED